MSNVNNNVSTRIIYTPGELIENTYTNKNYKFKLKYPEEYIVYTGTELDSLNSDMRKYEAFGQTESNDASLSILTIQSNTKTDPYSYLEELKNQLIEKNKTESTNNKSKYIIIKNEDEYLAERKFYKLETKILIDNEYYYQDYHCSKSSDKLFCIISIYNENTKELNNKAINNIKKISW